ncbi:MAG: TolC family protein, partial [Gammaproteobacteria bacterium]|nr:TolC family protein [Gammaproteobacteria bacterium]
NPRLAAAREHAAALETVPSQAGALPDPMVGVNLMSLPTDTFDFDQEPMTQLQLSFSQAIPYPGKRALMEAAALHEASAGVARADEVRLTLVADVRTVWWQVFRLDRALEIVAQNRALMRDFVEIAQTKYRVGDGLQQDVLLAQLEQSRLLDRELRLDGMRATTAARLNALLDRDSFASVVLPERPPTEALPDLPSVGDLLEEAIQQRPAMAAQSALVDAARARVDLSHRDKRPNFVVGAGYGYRQGYDVMRGVNRPDFLSVMLGVSVPLYAASKQDRAIDQRSRELSQRQFTLADTARDIQASISALRADYEAAREQVALFETAIIPQAQQTVASMLAGYQVNEVDFLNVINSQITLYNSQISYWDALSGAKAALARLAAAAGRETLYE